MAKQHSPGFERLCEAARARIKEITPEELAMRLLKGDDFVLIDVREDHEWRGGCLPKARHLGRGVLERDVEKAVPEAQADIVLYCGGGYRSALAAVSLAEMGYTNVASLRGGFRGWCERGLATTPTTGEGA